MKKTRDEAEKNFDIRINRLCNKHNNEIEEMIREIEQLKVCLSVFVVLYYFLYNVNLIFLYINFSALTPYSLEFKGWRALPELKVFSISFYVLLVRRPNLIGFLTLAMRKKWGKEVLFLQSRP